MGKGNNNRKSNDNPIIRRPKQISLLSKETNDIAEVVAELCIPAFEVFLRQGPLVKEGVTVYLHKEGLKYQILIAGAVVGKLTSEQSIMISKCSDLNILYNGIIVERKKGCYARFTRTPQ